MVAVFGDGWLPPLPSGWKLVKYLRDGWFPSSETGGCRLRPVVGSWSGISEAGGCRLRRRVVAVPAKWLEVGQVSRRRVVAVSAKCLGVGQVSRRRVVAVFGDGWLPSRDRDTREGGSTASVPPLKLKRKVVKATWISGSSVRPFPGACFLVSWVCGRPWPLAFCSGSVCGSGPVVCSWPCCVVWFRPPGLFQKEVMTQGTDPKTGFSDHDGRNKGRRTEDRSFNRYTLLRMGSIRLVRYDSGIGYVLWSLSWPLLSSSSPLSLVCSNPPAGVGGRTPTCGAGSPWRLFVFHIIFSWGSRSSSQVVLWDCSCCRR